MATSDRLRFGIVGIGFYAFIHHVPALRATGRAELVAISRRNPEALAQAKQALGVPEVYADWREMLERSRLDAVIVATSPGSHAAPAIAALERGLPVLVEKPLAASREDAWAMVRAAEAPGRTMMVAYQRRFSGLLRTGRRLLSEGAVGSVEQVGLAYSQNLRAVWDTATMPAPILEHMRKLGVPAFLPRELAGYWRLNLEQLGGGLFADTGSHFCDLALWLGGAPATTVVALSEPRGKPVERYITATARLANGVIAAVRGNNGTQMRSQLTVVGDQGTLIGEWPGLEGALELWIQQGDKRQQVVAGYEDQTPVAAFLATVFDGAPNLSPARNAAHVVDFVEAAYRSALEERVVRIEPWGVNDATRRAG